MTPHRFFLFRHGETDWNAQQRFQGHIDVPLNDRGREQARALVEIVRPLGLEAILSSDLSRARDTGQTVATALKIVLSADPGLREAHLGDAQGLTLEEIRQRFGQELAQRWRSTHLTDADIQYPGGETGRQVMARCLGVLEAWASNTTHGCTGVACHGGVVRRILQAVLPSGHAPLPIPNGVLYEVHWDKTEGWSLPAERHAQWLKRAQELDAQKL